MKRIVMVISLILVVLLAACGTQNRQANPIRQQTRHMKSQMQAPMKSQPQLHVSSVETDLPVNKHNVQNNESISDIAERYHVDINEFLRLNPGLAQQIGGNPNSNNGQVQVPNDSLNEPIPNNQTVTLPANDNMAGYEQQVLALTNQERQKAGLSACAGNDANLNRSARAKSQDMANNNYFSHQSPTYGDPFAMMRNFGVQYQSAGENIAMGQPTPAEVVQAWMNSPGHRKNILNGSFTHLGVGYVVQNGKPYWTQQFIGK